MIFFIKFIVQLNFTLIYKTHKSFYIQFIKSIFYRQIYCISSLITKLNLVSFIFTKLNTGIGLDRNRLITLTMAPIQIAILGAGTFVKHQYLPRLSEISHLFNLKSIWSRTQDSANAAVEIANKLFGGNVESKFGDNGLNDVIQDSSITAVLVVLAGQYQVPFITAFSKLIIG